MTGRDDVRTVTAIAGFALFGFLVWVALRVAPQVFGALAGALAASIVVATRAVDEEFAHWRERGIRLIAAGLLTAATYFLLDGLIGADVQMRRFDRAWEAAWPPDLQLFIAYPWATIPLSAGAALAGAGILLSYQAIKQGRRR